MKEAGSYRGCLSFFLERIAMKKKRKSLCNRKKGYGCGNQRKSGTIAFDLNQSSDEPSITTTGGEASLRRQLRFVDSFASSSLLSSDQLLKWEASYLQHR